MDTEATKGDDRTASLLRIARDALHARDLDVSTPSEALPESNVVHRLGEDPGNGRCGTGLRWERQTNRAAASEREQRGEKNERERFPSR
eukprot:scaffold1619_cov292-Pavlova_lutheri.AAC.9